MIPIVRFYGMVFLRAWRNTWFGQMQALFMLVAGGAISVGFIYFWLGGPEAVEEIPYVWAGFIGAFGALVLLFVKNLFAAPAELYFGERDAHAELAEKRRPKMQVYIDNSTGIEAIGTSSTNETYGGVRHTYHHDVERPALSLICKNIGEMRSGRVTAKIVSAECVEGDRKGPLRIIEPITLPWANSDPDDHLSAYLDAGEARRFWVARVRGMGQVWLMRDVEKLPPEYHQIFGPAGTYRATVQVSDGVSAPITTVVELIGQEGSTPENGAHYGEGRIAILEQFAESLLLSDTKVEKQPKNRRG